MCSRVLSGINGGGRTHDGDKGGSDGEGEDEPGKRACPNLDPHASHDLLDVGRGGGVSGRVENGGVVFRTTRAQLLGLVRAGRLERGRLGRVGGHAGVCKRRVARVFGGELAGGHELFYKGQQDGHDDAGFDGLACDEHLLEGKGVGGGGHSRRTTKKMDTENTSLAMMDGLPYGEGGVDQRESHEEEEI